MKKILFTLLLTLTWMGAKAQRVFEVTDITDSSMVYASLQDEACVLVRCHHSIALSFSSSMDKTASPYKTAAEGTDSLYYIQFPTGKRYRGRTLRIVADGFKPVELALELRPKQLVTLQLTDPDITIDAGCYSEYRNKGIEEIKKMNYKDAKRLFEIARQCSDVDTIENTKNLRLVDTLLFYRLRADESYQRLKHKKSAMLYQHIMSLNPYDSYSQERYNTAMMAFYNDCDTKFQQAEIYFAQKDYKDAIQLYQRIMDNGCTQAPMAAIKLEEAKRRLEDKKQHARVLTYEWMDNLPIGLHTGSYRKKKTGGFFNIALNDYVFKIIRSENTIENYPELKMTFGWTFPIYGPVWGFAGPGIMGKAYYGKYKENNYPMYEKGSELEDGEKEKTSEELAQSLKAAIAIPITGGIVVKYSYFALRIGYEYRFSIKKELENFVGKNKLVIGIGFAF